MDKRKTKPVKAKCMNCTAETTITDKDQPCPVCMLCGSLAWQDVFGPTTNLLKISNKLVVARKDE